MKTWFILTLWLTLIAGSAMAMSSVGTTEVFFSPKGGATEAIVKEIENAQQEI